MNVILPDGSQKELPDGASGADLAAAIGPGLARAALAVKVGGEVRDLARQSGEGALAAMRAIKRALDPQGILNPGKVLPD